MRLKKYFLLFFSLSISALTPSAETVETVKIGETFLTLEIARSEAEQQRGLMHRKALPQNHGMLFCLKRDQNVAMWMKNTDIDLDALFIDKTGTVFNDAQMKARTTTLHYALGQARYVIETNAGWVKRHNIRRGFKIVGLDKLCKKPQ